MEWTENISRECSRAGPTWVCPAPAGPHSSIRGRRMRSELEERICATTAASSSAADCAAGASDADRKSVV